jgi:hypothetical protein
MRAQTSGRIGVVCMEDRVLAGFGLIFPYLKQIQKKRLLNSNRVAVNCVSSLLCWKNG